MPGHILVPTDFSEPAARALEIALSLAQKFEAKLTLVHVYSAPATAHAAALTRPIHEAASAAQGQLDRALAQLKQRYPSCDGVVCAGTPAERIVETARERGADLLVIGTQGLTGLHHFLLGSVAERVVRTSPVPVLTVPPKREPEPPGPRPERNAG